MRRIFLCIIVVAVATSAEAQDNKKAEAILVKVDAVEIAQEFEKDAKAARKRYDPDRRKVGLAGRLSRSPASSPASMSENEPSRSKPGQRSRSS